jgi:hypothetical protein
MKIVLSLIVVLFLSSCSSTKVYDRNGRLRFATQGDCEFQYHGADGTMLAGTFNHSGPTIAGGNAVAEMTDSVGRSVVGGILAGATGPVATTLVPKLAGGIAAAIPTKAAAKL